MAEPGDDLVKGDFLVDADGVIVTSDLTECDRSMRGHAWFEADDPGRWNPYRRYFARWVDKCERCGSYRFRGLNAYGRVECTWYDYSPAHGWADRWGVGNDRPSGDEIRYARLKRRKGQFK